MTAGKLAVIPIIVVLLSVYAWVASDWQGNGTITGVSAQAPDPVLEQKVAGDTVIVRVDGVGKARLHRADDGTTWFTLAQETDLERRLTPQRFAEVVFGVNHGRGFWYKVLNISTLWGVAWVSLGLAGQVAFTGRMVVQWIASEKAKRSVVPVAFWWMSLIGSTMLLVYFAWRRDVVGLLGQGTGWYIYLRNLVLIYTHAEADTAD